MAKKSTEELFVELKTEKNLEKYLSRNKNEFKIPLNEYLTKLLKSKKVELKDLAKNCNLAKSYLYNLFSGQRQNPSREKVLAIGIALELDLEEVQYLLRYAKQSPLYPRDAWDSVIISAIEQKLNVFQTNELLEQCGEKNFLE